MTREFLGSKTLYYNDGLWSASDGGGWLDGVFDTRETALAAFKHWKRLHEIQARKNAEAGGTGGVITMADLSADPSPGETK